MRLVKSAELRQYFEESRGLERDYLEEVVSSRRMAWRVAVAAVAVAVLALVTLVVLLPLKRVDGFVVRVDNATGSVDIVRALRDGQASYGEVVDKYWLNKYVLARESYDWETLQTAYDTTALLSSAAVQQEYAAIFDGPKARQDVWGSRVRVIVRVRSITPGGPNIATVRFTRKREESNGAPPVEESLVATIGFRYSGAAMKESDRLVNPLGLEVTSYRVDPEVVAASE